MFSFSTKIRLSDYVGSSQGLTRLSAMLLKLGSRCEPFNEIHGPNPSLILLTSLTLGLFSVTYV